MDNVLIIAPHPDDAELGVGGTIVKHKERGDHVSVMILCSEKFQNCDHEPDAEKQGAWSLGEAALARKVLGYDELFFAGLEDETLDRCILDILHKAEPIYNKIKPDIVYVTHHGDNNQDHRAAFEAAQVLCRPISRHTPRQFLTYETPSGTDQTPNLAHTIFLPNHYSVLDWEQVEKKINAVECYKSELRHMPHARCADGICSYANFRGIQCGSDFAEAFCMIREVCK